MACPAPFPMSVDRPRNALRAGMEVPGYTGYVPGKKSEVVIGTAFHTANAHATTFREPPPPILPGTKQSGNRRLRALSPGAAGGFVQKDQGIRFSDVLPPPLVQPRDPLPARTESPVEVTAPASPPSFPRAVPGYAGYVPNSRDHYGESFRRVHERSTIGYTSCDASRTTSAPGSPTGLHIRSAIEHACRKRRADPSPQSGVARALSSSVNVQADSSARSASPKNVPTWKFAAAGYSGYVPRGQRSTVAVPYGHPQELPREPDVVGEVRLDRQPTEAHPGSDSADQHSVSRVTHPRTRSLSPRGMISGYSGHVPRKENVFGLNFHQANDAAEKTRPLTIPACDPTPSAPASDPVDEPRGSLRGRERSGEIPSHIDHVPRKGAASASSPGDGGSPEGRPTTGEIPSHISHVPRKGRLQGSPSDAASPTQSPELPCRSLSPGAYIPGYSGHVPRVGPRNIIGLSFVAANHRAAADEASKSASAEAERSTSVSSPARQRERRIGIPGYTGYRPKMAGENITSSACPRWEPRPSETPADSASPSA